MTEGRINGCVQAFNNLLDVRYHFVLGRAGKSLSFDLAFSEFDCHHLMGLHYLLDRPDTSSRHTIFNKLLTSQEYREWIASSDFWDPRLSTRLACVRKLETMLDDNQTIFRYIKKFSRFHSKIQAEYLMMSANVDISFPILTSDAGSMPSGTDNGITNSISLHLCDESHRDVYIFLDKQPDSENRYCKSIFPKEELDYTEGQTKWTLLYKEKVKSGNSTVLFHHKGYELPPSSNRYDLPRNNSHE